MVVGDGPQAAPLEAEARHVGVDAFVRFAAASMKKTLREAYRTSDLFILPAVVDGKGDTEGLGVVLLEALEFGLPLIASDVGGIPDIVRHGETGLLVPPGDVTALADAVARVVEDPAAAK